MDSVTQFVLGAAAGGAILGKKAGNRAIIWGGIAGTIPDLDVFLLPFMDEPGRLHFHRGISHSIIFNLLLAPILGIILHRLNRKRESLKEWVVFSYITLFSAVLLDCFTVYGTHVFKPFSDYRIAFNNISIIDPVYTLPLLVAFIAALFIRTSFIAKHKVLVWGLVLSSMYMLFTIGMKMHVNSIVKENISNKGIYAERFMTAPTLFNSILWRATIETANGYQVGYYSLFDGSKNIDFRFIKRNENILKDFKGTRELNTLLWFSKGWYTLHRPEYTVHRPEKNLSAALKNDFSENKNTIFFNDIRFGELHTDFEKKGTHVFKWKLEKTEKGIQLQRSRPENPGLKKFLSFLWKRIKGVDAG